MKEYHLFISYSRLDDTTYNKHTKQKSAIDIILSRLRKEKIKYWIDREGKYCGAEFEEVIVNAIDNSEMLLFISSTNSNTKSEWVTREVKNASRKNMTIIPLLIDDAKYAKKIELTLEGIDKREFFKNPKEALDNVINSIKEQINRIKKEEEEALAKKKADELQKKEEEDRIKKADAEKKRIEKLKDEIERLQKQLIASIDKQQDYLNKWLTKRKELSEATSESKECPICNGKNEEKANYCEFCGWHFGLPKELLFEELQQQYEERLETSAMVWQKKKDAEAMVKTLHNEQRSLKAKQEQLQNEFEQAKSQAKADAEEWRKILLSKQEQIVQLEKTLNNTKAQLTVAKKSIDELKTKAEQAKASRTPVAFLLVTEFGQSNVYLLYEGQNVFGALGHQNQSPEYQTIVATEEKLMPRHFEIRINKKDKGFDLRTKPISSTCSLAYNSTTNLIEMEQPVRFGDILYIGGVKIQIIDNFNKQ